MAQLALKGHLKRGIEVIQLLEMLGGNNNYSRYCGYNTNVNTIYYIDYSDRNFIKMIENPSNISDFIVFTIEDFEEKFSYKVGDIVKCHNIWKGIIESMEWYEGEVLYHVRDYSNDYLASETVEHLQPYIEETMEERKYVDLRLDVDQDDKLATEVTINGNKIIPPKNYLIGKITKVDNGMLVEFVKKQPQYPKDYLQCCEYLGHNPFSNNVSGYRRDVIESLQTLITCRDAYWKIAGEEMGLDKPWEPDWKDNYQKKWTICFYQGEINLTTGPNVHRILAFPTAEMRDVFYENFRELIEQCKELL